MTDQESINRFVCLRAQGWSFHRIALEIKVSKPTLIKWSRVHQFEIQNLRATETEELAEKLFKPRHERWKSLGQQMDRLEQELAQRKLDTVSTARLWSLAAGLRAEIARQCPPASFSEAARAIPPDEYVDEITDWQV